MSPAIVPANTTVLVIGGGPAGSFASSILAQEGVDVVCCEATLFPRYHIGESLLASVKAFLKMVNACEKIEGHGFHPKPGSAIKFRPDRIEAYTDFVAVNPKNGSWNVTRSEFDEILLKHASETGASVFEATKITSLDFDPLTKRPYAASYTSNLGGCTTTGTIKFDYLIDCSGRQGIMSTKYLKNRHINQSLKNVATWGYWTGKTGVYGSGTQREGAIYIEGLTNGAAGWVWFIPLADKVSIGIVMHEIDCNRLRQDAGSMEEFYIRELKRAPNVMEMLANAVQTSEGEGSSVRMASDYSYSATRYGDEGWRLAGDASAFIDPFFSSGVHLAFNGGLSAAISVMASIRGDVSEKAAAAYHDKKISMSYTRFLMVVLAAYKQLKLQDMDVLCDVTTGSFDAAFEVLRPVIQGTGDIDASHTRDVTEEELGKTMDFIASVLTTSSADMASAQAAGYVPAHFFDREGTMLGPDEIVKLVKDTGADEVTERVLRSINARKSLHLYDPSSNFEHEEVHGMVAKLGRGGVGLRMVNALAVGSVSGKSEGKPPISPTST